MNKESRQMKQNCKIVAFDSIISECRVYCIFLFDILKTKKKNANKKIILVLFVSKLRIFLNKSRCEKVQAGTIEIMKNVVESSNPMGELED